MGKYRRAKLTRGCCDCGKPAYIPWRDYKFCYECWHIFQKSLMEVLANERETERKEEEKKRASNFIKQSPYFTF